MNTKLAIAHLPATLLTASVALTTLALLGAGGRHGAVHVTGGPGQQAMARSAAATRIERIPSKT